MKMMDSDVAKTRCVALFWLRKRRMATLSEENACLGKRHVSALPEAFHPVEKDLRAAEALLAITLQADKCPVSREIVHFLLESPGKRLRPALVFLSARAAGTPKNGRSTPPDAVVKLAVAVELIHMASLVHDDLLDGAMIRHHRPSINARWGREVSVALGDLLCAKAFRLVADCRDSRLFDVVGSELSAMCEGEMLQVADRTDFDLSEQHCLKVIEKKTASLFSACCHAGALLATDQPDVSVALQRFGFHFGVAFQILDDCRDLLADREDLGKEPGQDWFAGDVTLPLLYASRYGGGSGWLPPHGSAAEDPKPLACIDQAFWASEAPARIMGLADSQIDLGRQQLQLLAHSPSRASLEQLADRIAVSMADILKR
jgi:geranylgeranyl pyrophosphate synthase